MTLKQLIKKSISLGYLPNDWNKKRKNGDNLVICGSGFYSLESECIKTNRNEYFHKILDAKLFCIDEINNVYIASDEAVVAHGAKEAYITHYLNPNIVYYIDTYYIKNDLAHFGLVITHSGFITEINHSVTIDGRIYSLDEVFYWESDGKYHLEPDPYVNPNSLYRYHDGPPVKDFRNDKQFKNTKGIFGIGFEIEKSEMPEITFYKKVLYNETGCVIEKDASVENGFELKTPIYNLFSLKTEERLLQIKDFIDVPHVVNAGGHINFSYTELHPEKLLDAVRGFIPLIYSMNNQRIYNNYCKANKIKNLKYNLDKYQSIRIRNDYLEFRIFSAVKSFEDIIFRLNFFRIIAENLFMPFNKVLQMALNENSLLYKTLRNSIYRDNVEFESLITGAIYLYARYSDRKIKEENISKLLNTAKNKISNKNQSLCVSQF